MNVETARNDFSNPQHPSQEINIKAVASKIQVLTLFRQRHNAALYLLCRYLTLRTI